MNKVRTRTLLAALAMYSSLLVAADIYSREVDFRIQAQPLASALIQFSEQAGLQVMSQGVDLQQQQAPGVSGRLTVARALTLLLADSKLSYVETAPNTIAITPSQPTRSTAAATMHLAQADTSQEGPSAARERAETTLHEMEMVTVYGRGAQASTVREVPQSMTVFNPEIMDVIAGPNVDDVIRFLPSTNNLLGDFAFGSNFNVRGSSPSFTFNGMLPSPTKPGRIGLVNVERVEVLMGPSSITYGSMAPGAVINIVTKQPTREFHSQLELQGGSWDTYGGSVDIGGPLGKSVRARLNASYVGRGAPIDHWQQNTTVIAPVMAFDLSDRTLLTIEGTYDRTEHPDGIYDGRIPTFGTLLPNPNGRIPMSTNTGYFEGVTHQVETYKDVSVRLTHQFSDTLSLNAQVTWADSYRAGIDGFGGALTANNRTITRTLTHRDQGSESHTAAINIAAQFSTGPVTHKVIVGADYLTSEAFGYLGNYAPAVGTIPQLDVFTPNYGIAQPVRLTRTIDVVNETDATAVFVQERAIIGDLSLVAGARYTDSSSNGHQTTVATGVTTRPRDTVAKEWSTQLGALYDITDAWMVWASRSTSFLPRAPVLLRNGTFFTVPETAVQYEVGSRYVFPDSQTTLSLAIYQVVTPDVLTRDPEDFNFFVPAGELTSKGAEVSVSGKILPGLTALASYGYNPTEVTKSNVPGQEGLEFQNAPKHTASLVTRYDIASGLFDGLSLSAAVNYVGRRFAEAANLRELPAYTRTDLGIHYHLNDGIEFSLQANNITDKDIYSGFQTGVIARNPGRNYMFSVRVTPTGF